MATTPEKTTAPLQRRYREAYSVADATIGWGTVLKIRGMLGGVPRQNLIRLAQEHRDPSIRRQAHDSEPGWR
jgi:hypothetical protein